MNDDEDYTSTGHHLIRFLELYGCQFNYLHTGIRIRDGGSYFRKNDGQAGECENRYQYSLLCVEDPLNSGILRLCNSFLCLRHCSVAGDIMLFSGCAVCMSLCVGLSVHQNVVNIILKSIGHIFTKLPAVVHFRTRMNASNFGMRRSKVKFAA